MNNHKDYLKSYRRIKFFELLLLFIFEAFFLILIFSNSSLRTAILTNKLIFTLGLVTWICMLVSLIYLIIDFFLLRMTAFENQALASEAFTDTLTGLPNRFSVDMILKLHNTKESISHCCCVAFRLSNLQQINAQYSHATGDKMLLYFGSVLEAIGSRYGFVGRNGGNEFIIFIENCSQEKVLQFIAEIYEEAKRYNEEHEAYAIALEYNYALNPEANAECMADLLKTAYQKLNHSPLQ